MQGRCRDRLQESDSEKKLYKGVDILPSSVQDLDEMSLPGVCGGLPSVVQSVLPLDQAAPSNLHRVAGTPLSPPFPPPCVGAAMSIAELRDKPLATSAGNP